MQFYSQVAQDRFVFEHFFRGKRGGVFVDIGAYDGETYSNTLFLERFMGWRGLCVEPLPSAFAKLTKVRTAICEPVCLADFEGEADFVESDDRYDEKMLSGLDRNFDPRHRERLRKLKAQTAIRKVPVTRLAGLLEKHGLFDIDFCTIDTEGSEYAILSDLDFSRFNISVFTIENNYNDDRIALLMAGKGYDFVARLKQDLVFKKKAVARLPQTSVICAVPHDDPDREALLRGHVAILARQSVPVQPIYVFEGGDRAPSWLAAATLCVNEPLTTYQAWNVALARADTPFVMNLNLGDRLAPNAVEILESAMAQSKADLVGGDWRLCHKQADTDAVTQVLPLHMVPFDPNWPPVPGTPTRLGSGGGERRTFGPATMWRLDAHIGSPRYPWRLADGSLVHAAGEMLWWTALAEKKAGTCVRLPLIIGNHRRYPGTPAERPTAADDEMNLYRLVGGATL